MPMPFDYNAAYGNLKPGMMGGGNPLGSSSGGLSSNMGGIMDILGGILGFGSSGYKDYQKMMEEYLNRAAGYQNPFYGAGVGAIGDYQKWLSGMSDPTKFINETMGKYESSPWANYLQKQASNAATNQASAAGLTGSTPLTQFSQENAKNIASSDMQNWLQNVLGINTQYGGGLQNLMSGGQHSADILSGLFSGAAGPMGESAYGKRRGGLMDIFNILSGAGSLFGF